MLVRGHFSFSGARGVIGGVDDLDGIAGCVCTTGTATAAALDFSGPMVVVEGGVIAVLGGAALDIVSF